MTDNARLIKYARGSDLKDDPLVIDLANALEQVEAELRQTKERLGTEMMCLAELRDRGRQEDLDRIARLQELCGGDPPPPRGQAVSKVRDDPRVAKLFRLLEEAEETISTIPEKEPGERLYPSRASERMGALQQRNVLLGYIWGIRIAMATLPVYRTRYNPSQGFIDLEAKP